jgi:hypothetical protein
MENWVKFLLFVATYSTAMTESTEERRLIIADARKVPYSVSSVGLAEDRAYDFVQWELGYKPLPSWAPKNMAPVRMRVFPGMSDRGY